MNIFSFKNALIISLLFITFIFAGISMAQSFGGRIVFSIPCVEGVSFYSITLHNGLYPIPVIYTQIPGVIAKANFLPPVPGVRAVASTVPSACVVPLGPIPTPVFGFRALNYGTSF